MTTFQTLTRRSIVHNARADGPRRCEAYQVGSNPRQFLVERDATADSGWKLADRLDRSVPAQELYQRYGIWEDRPQPVGPTGVVPTLLRAMGAYPVQHLPPDQRIQANEVSLFLEPDKLHVGGWGTMGHWSSTQLVVAPGQAPTLVEQSDAVGLGLAF